MWDCQLSVNLYQLVSTSIKLPVSSKWQKVTLQEYWLFGCLGQRSRTWAHSKFSEAEQLGLFQCNFLFALYQSSCSGLNSQLKFRTVSWNHHKSQQTCVWTKQWQECSSWLTGSNLLFAFSAYGMGKEGHKSSGLLLAGLLWVTCLDDYSKDWPPLAKMLH